MNLNRLLVGSVLGLLFLVMSGSLFLLVRENHNLKEAATESQSIAFEDSYSSEEIEKLNQEDVRQTDASAKALFVEGVFQQFLPYTEDTYLSRFDGVADKLDDAVLDQLKGMVATLEPGIQVQNTVQDLAVYTKGTDTDHYLVVARVSLQVGEGIDSVYTQVYQATLAPGEPYRIQSMASLGSITPFDRE
ncbi:hypothetical protein G7058_11780 (plasmid) [Jeotgalibaca porci]|uniref:Uncharacterized protein n=1 Tax=Jeotgalibaca porci TaxID=1868793 RepID=A0A6G7WKQ6_9LACT|nr:hypothetical protein [Jeotgalibaca porci]QIK52799.1 hypothetical protein G7058_11780 [Jeotgalibaca porci]